MKNYTLTELSNEMSLPRTTLYRYLVAHKEFLAISKKGRRMFIDGDCIAVLQEIREQYDAGKDSNQVRDYLIDTKQLPTSIEIDTGNDNEQPQSLTPAKAMTELARTMQDVSIHLKEQQGESMALKEEILRQTRTLQRLEEKILTMEKGMEKVIRGKGSLVKRILDI